MESFVRSALLPIIADFGGSITKGVQATSAEQFG
jgi:hypothetical protein